ncbi:MAG: hypothetical protein KF775_19645, partial [Cyclobacteriaceae bacterium]|nr:hypothetical protein [Cyclobacteriaceae bacterium]
MSSTSAPSVYTVTGGGNYCAGDVASAPEVIMLASDPGVVYTIFRSATAVSTATGTGGPLSLGTYTAAGSYTAIANLGAGAGCQTSMSGSATIGINPLPNVYSVTGGGNFCAGGSGVAVGMSFGQTGVLYNLKTVGGGTLTSAAGTNSAITFGSITVPGTYSVQASTTATGCTNAMTGTVTVGTVNVPVAQTVTGGGAYCSGGSGVAVGLANSATGVSYQLFNGATAGSISSGTGTSISFGSQTAAGVYTVMATQTTGSVSCTTAMSGSATVVVNSNPAVYSVTGGGAYCAGGSGMTVGLNGSQAGVNYALYTGTVVATTVAGTGSAISFGTFTATGTYTVRATNATTSCVSDMSGNAVISINALPTVNSVGGGGSYCAGGTGLAVTLSGSQSGVNYTLSRSGSVVVTLPGTGGSLTFGTFTEAGLYTVLATNTTTGCTSAQSGSATITINPLPTVQTITGGGNYCSGGTGVVVGLGGGQAGVTYTLYRGTTLVTTVASTSSAPVSFPSQTVAGTYSAYAVITATGCGTNMSGTTTIGINPLPTAYAVTGTGNYCSGGSGVAVGLAGSQGGVNYNLYNGTAIVGSASGTGTAVSFGMYTTASTYTVLATNATTGCTNAMSGGAIVGINPLPTAVTVTSSASSYCAGDLGIDIGLSGSTSGVNYQLYMGSTPAGVAVSGTGGPLTIGTYTAAGTYTVSATNTTTGCMRNMSGAAVVNINALPTMYAVTSSGSNYCAGGTGITMGLAGSESGVSYQLYNGAGTVGTPVSGTGSSISFGVYTASGTYTVLATNTTTSCSRAMSGAANVTINSLPVAQTVTSSGTSYCAGTSGIAIGLGNSAVGVSYQLYNGVTPVGGAVAGTGSALSLGSQTMAGTYMVVGTSSATGCSNNMTGTASVSINPAPNTFNVTGGGAYCQGSTGVSIGLSGSNAGVNYQLYNGTLAVGGPVAGTGAAFTFPGTYTTTGTYNVVASTGLGCTSNMTGSASVNMNVLPGTYNVTGGGAYCNGGSGVHVGLSGSQAGIAYQLYNGTTPVGSFTTGTGLALDFGLKTAGGTYTVLAYNPATSCISNMSGSAVISVNNLPVVQSVSGGGSYCNGTSTGVSIGLENSQAGVSYQLYNGTAIAGSPVLGTGSAIDFGNFMASGTYTAVATAIGSGCQNAMSGSASVSISPLPNIQVVTGGGTICAGSTGANVYLNNSQSGVNYQLYNGPAPVGAPVSGTGSSMNLGAQTASGTYTVQAINATTGCVRNMSGAATINVNAQPALHTVTGG